MLYINLSNDFFINFFTITDNYKKMQLYLLINLALENFTINNADKQAFNNFLSFIKRNCNIVRFMSDRKFNY